jgi:hypothetical protein
MGTRFFTDSFGIATVAIALFAAGLAWYFAPRPEPGPALVLMEEPLELAAGKIPDLKKAAQVVAQSRLWGDAGAGAVTQQDPEWHFVGIGGRGKERFVMMKMAGKPVQTLSVGDTLPGGARILEIGEDRLCILINEVRRALEVYRR